MGRRQFTGLATFVVALQLAGSAQAAQEKVVADDGAPDDTAGQSVAIEGDTAVVGAPFADVGGNTGQGAAFVFTRSGDAWTQTGKLTASDGTPNDRLGTSVAIDGQVIAVGAVGAGDLVGAVYTFTRTGAAARTESAKLTATDGNSVDQLGASVAIDGDTVVAGAPRDSPDPNFSGQGSVYTFASMGVPARTETAKLTASDAFAGEELGSSVAIDGDVIVAGAPGAGVGQNTSQGAAYTFARTGAAARTETAKLTVSNGNAFDEASFAVDIDGDTIVAGAPGFDVGQEDELGAVYTFASTGAAARTETARLTSSASSTDAELDQIGTSVGIDGATIVAGAPADAFNSNSSQGSLYTFARAGAAVRTETSRLVDSDGATGDRLGESVAIDGGSIIGGAPNDNVGTDTGTDQGSATIFFRSTGPEPACDDGVDNDGDGLIDFPADTGCTSATDANEAGDVTPPDTTITKGPKSPTKKTTAKFEFTGSDNATAAQDLTFECSLDGGAFSACASPKSYDGLKKGKHEFAVRATDVEGNTDPEPAEFFWTIKKKRKR